MNWPFDPGETITLIGIYTTVVLGYAELKIGAKNREARIADLEADMKEIKQAQTRLDLATQALEQVKDVLDEVKHELKNQRAAMLQMERLLGRLEAKVGFE